MGWNVGIDIGGTFTDIVAVSRAGEFRHAKTMTTSPDPLTGLRNAIASVGLAEGQVRSLIHGTTMVTNSLVENRLARVALIATDGFRDVLQIARASRDHLYRLDLPPRAAPVVPRDLTFGVKERVAPDGAVLHPLDEAEIRRAADWIRQVAPDAVAICLLHAYANSDHEAALARGLRDILGDACPFLSVSSAVSPEAREYERTMTTVLNAAVMPQASSYLDRLIAALPADVDLRLFHSAGGMASPAVLRSLPLSLGLSGPAAGASATASVCQALGIARGLAFDMGGTTTDVCLVSDGSAEISSDCRLGGRPVRQPMVAIESVGAGGGSLVGLGAGGLSVGPRSAGSAPGPACYGLGGTQPTVTDALAVLGYLDPERVLGGTIHVDPARARQALEPIAATLGCSVERTALGIIDVANAVMSRALRRVTVRRGTDIRETALVAFGGAGPMLAVALARQVDIGTVVVPAFSSGFSAYGCVVAPPLITRQKTVRLASAAWDAVRFAAERQALIGEARALLRASGVVPEAIVVEEVALVRYVGQSTAVPLPVGDIAAGDIAALGTRFRAAHHRIYGYATDESFLVESLRVAASVPPQAVPGRDGLGASGDVPGRAPAGAAAASRFLRCCFDEGGFVETPCYDRENLPVGAIVPGPAIIQDEWSTTILPSGSRAHRDAAGHLHVEVRV
jgi:N-methylhydantoinase A